MKLAYFVRPHVGGTYSVFLNLREGLAARGIDLQWVAMDDWAVDDQPVGESDLARGFFVSAPQASTDRDRAAALMETLERRHFDGVFINVLAQRLQMNLARYLPDTMLRIMIVHNITPATYAAARSIRDNVHATVTVSDRARNDLISRHGFSPRRTRTIANAVSLPAIANGIRTGRQAKQLRLMFLGRIEDASKGVFWLPSILDRLPSSICLTVVGDGSDLPELRKRLDRHGTRVVFKGSMGPDAVARELAEHDVMIMPSRFEGFGMTIIEAMAAGCIPVVSHIRGVTDTIVENETTGFLFAVGDWRKAADQIAMLEQQPSLLADLSRAARQQAEARFNVTAMTNAYCHLIEDIRHEGRAVAAPMTLNDWSVPTGFRPGLRTYLPMPVKNWLRVARERL